MAALDWLFGSSPPPSVTSTVTNETSAPAWFQEMMRANLGQASAVAGAPYTPYTGTRVQPFSTDQMNAFNTARNLPGMYGGAMDVASGALGGLPGMPTASEAGAPYLTQAGQTWPGAVNDYMNPYMENVTDRIAELGNRNLFEKVLPNVNDIFISSGQFGSSRHGDFTGRAIRDATNEIAGQQAGALAQGYNQAAGQFGADMSRLAGVGSSMGALSNLDTQAALNTVQGAGALASLQQGLGLKDAAALEAAGQAQQQLGQRTADVNYEEFLKQRGYPQEMVTWFNNLLRGSNVGSTSTGTSVGPATSAGPSPLAQLAGAGISLASLL